MTLPRASLRANKALGFDANGNPVISDTLGTNRGNWTAGVLYYVRDIVKDTTNNNIWQVITQHTSSGSQPINTNADSAKWTLLVDAASATASASAAASSASAASTSASNASTSASNASTSASNASTSASNAASSASAASTSASNAAASYDSFDDRYLGPKSSAPSVDNDGNSLLTGALYWDTVVNQIRVWSGTAWVNVNASASNTRTAITATAGQTVLTVAAYTPGTNTMVVYVNGVKLNASEYTETNSTTVTVTTGLALNDEVEVFSYRVNEIGTLGASSVTFTQTGTGATARNAQVKLQETVSVKDFGAIGNGVANDTSAIQAAINYAAPLGVSVFVPAGTYKITALTLPLQHGGIEIYGEAMNSGYNMENAIYRGSVLVSTQATGNIISCDGGVAYSNRGIRIRNLNIRVSTIDYAIYIKRSPELNLLENLTVYNDHPSGGSGLCLESCWVGTRVNGCAFNAAAIGANNIGINVFNDIKAGGVSIEDTNATKFAKCIRIGGDVYQATLRNVGGEVGKYGFYIDGNDPKVLLDTCHCEFNTDIAVYIEKSGGVTVTNSTFYRNAESASGVKAEIYVASGGGNYNYNTEVSNCNFFGLGTNVTAVYISNPSFGSGVISNNTITAFGSGTTGLYMGGGDKFNFTVVDNLFNAAATPYNPTDGYKTFNAALAGNYQIRFAATPILSADANTLDDYEEGTWTPVLGGDGGQSGQSYSMQQGYYQKIGNRVYFTFAVELSNAGSPGLEAVLKGLPFTIGGARGLGAAYVSDFANLGLNVVELDLRINENGTQLYFRHATAAAASLTFPISWQLYTNTTFVNGGGWYQTA
jgi:hypothetical protein